MTLGRRGGFTLVELLLVAVMGALLVVVLHGLFVQQRRFALWEDQVVRDHDAFRVASSILGADFREIVATEGDVALHATDSMSVRAPLGFALVCSVRANPAAIGLTRAQGSMWTGTGDSLLVYTTGGWRALVPTGEMRNVPGPLRCSIGTESPDHVYSLDRGAADSIVVGAPVRVYRRHTYHAGLNDGRRWLARTDAQGTQLLVGPTTGEGIRFRLVDESGNATGRLADVTGVELRLLLPLTRVSASSSATEDTLTLVFQGRNR